MTCVSMYVADYRSSCGVADDHSFQLVQTVIDQSHLMPVLNSVQPVLADFDHALRLYPAPTAVSRRLRHIFQ